MDNLKEEIQGIFRRVSSSTQQLGMADLKEIENRILDLLKGKVVVDKQELRELMKDFPKTYHADRQAKKKFEEFFGITEEEPQKPAASDISD